MELQTITQPQDQAEAAFKEYRAAFMAERNRIDGELMRGYKALKEGKQLIRLADTIKAGGVDEQGRPRLAIARADEEQTAFRRELNGSVAFSPTINWEWGRNVVRAADRRFEFPAGTLPEKREDDEQPFDRGANWVATLPIIPPRLRPPHSLSGYHVLWEAEWHRPRRTRAPYDPALLKHIGGDLYAVLAVWDLTPLEQAVLEMRSVT